MYINTKWHASRFTATGSYICNQMILLVRAGRHKNIQLGFQCNPDIDFRILLKQELNQLGGALQAGASASQNLVSY